MATRSSNKNRTLRLSTKQLIQLLIFFLILIAIPATYILVQSNNDIRGRAYYSTGGVAVGPESGCCHPGSEGSECKTWFGSVSTCTQGNGACETGWQCKGGSGQGGKCTENCTGKSCGEWICGHTIQCNGACGKGESGCDFDGTCESIRGEKAGNCSDCSKIAPKPSYSVEEYQTRIIPEIMAGIAAKSDSNCTKGQPNSSMYMHGTCVTFACKCDPNNPSICKWRLQNWKQSRCN